MAATQSASIDRQMTAATWAQLVLLGAIWGGSFFFARIAVAEMHPLVLVLCRVAIAALVLHLYLAIAGPPFASPCPTGAPFSCSACSTMSSPSR